MAEERREPISVLICDDHKILTDALARLIAQEADLRQIVPPVHAPQDAIELCGSQALDVVLMDIVFKGPMNGIEATRRIKEISPATKVLIMTAHEEDHLLVEAVEAGASGFLGKSEAAAEVLDAVRAAADDQIYFDAARFSRVLQHVASERQKRLEADAALDQLTEREHQILQLMAEGVRNDHIATRLFISPQTVNTHVRNILAKLCVHSRLEAVAFAVKHGAVSV